MGSSACYHLAKNGFKVLGLEQFDLGHSQGSSHGQTRIIRKAYFEHADYVPLLLRSYELWRDLSLEARQTLYHETGLIYFSPQGSKLIDGLFESSKKYQIPLERLTQAQLKPYATRFYCPDNFESVYEPEAGYLEVENCVAAYSSLAKKHGARIVSGERVLSWSATPHAVKVVTDKNTYEGSHLVMTAGAWTSQLLKDLRLPLKILRKILFWFKSSNDYDVQNHTPCFLYDTPAGVFYGFPKLPYQDSTMSFSAIKVAEHSGGEAISDPAKIERGLLPGDKDKILEFVKNFMPGVSHSLEHFKTCMYTVTPDEHFVIDKHPEHENVIFAGGFSGHGFKFASVVGEILFEMTTQRTTRHPIDFLKVRF